jgi:hypothetical protein
MTIQRKISKVPAGRYYGRNMIPNDIQSPIGTTLYNLSACHALIERGEVINATNNQLLFDTPALSKLAMLLRKLTPA